MVSRSLLIVEDDPGLQSQMRWCFDGQDVSVAGNASEAESLSRKHQPQVITLDLGLPPDPGGTSEGFRLLDSISELLPFSKIIVITGREEQETALRAVANGAYDFYQKPIDSNTLQFVVERAFRLWELEEENRRLSQLAPRTPLEGLITASPNMLELCRLLERVAPTDATVLILGETGTGKEIFARATHDLSTRRDGSFTVINCAAIPENLLESELFGHEKGSFTGAINRKIGKIEAANGGTLFLDEIGDMPMGLQAKILRFLQERTIERVGGNRNIDLDVRVLTATHRSIKEMISKSDFREDLYFRISEITLNLPPLRERAGDAVLLATAFVDRYRDKPNLKLSSGCLKSIESYKWPGNVRELQNRTKRACIMADGPLITPRDFELQPTVTNTTVNLKEVRSEAERLAILDALNRSERNISQAARLLGVSRPTLYNLFRKYGISVDETDE
ncbi:MAG: PEP-CTERM-box response regulator transcription factor [Gammaproteobacteria bacterium]|nr:PEP-CTERM-box response regulator transcription factor [Gammaproteobacteria bacterium]